MGAKSAVLPSGSERRKLMSKGKGAGKGVDPRKKPRAKGQALPHSFLVPATYLWACQRQGEEPARSEQSSFRLILETHLKKCYGRGF